MDFVHLWRFVPQTDTQGLKKKQRSLWDFTQRVRELYLAHAL